MAAVVKARSLGGSGTVLVAGSNGMTVYKYRADVAGSGKSACNGGCATSWPPLTVPRGTSLTDGSGASGKLATIRRSDGTLQVTYNGHPLYFFAGDSAPGDVNGVYGSWNTVKP